MDLNNTPLLLQQWMIEHHKTLACAESCTGGYLSHLITSHSGASQYFLGSFITYTNELKESSLSVKKEDLIQYGAVSKTVVLSMLEGLFQKTKADFGIAVSGIAGPEGGSFEKPIGTVWFAIGQRGKEPGVGVLQLTGNRLHIIQEASLKILALCYQKVKSS